MGWRNDWYWHLPPESSFEQVEMEAEMLRLDAQFRRLRRCYRIQKFKDRLSRVGNIRRGW